MKKTIWAILAALFSGSLYAAENLITLDLSKSTTPLSFDAQTGAWTGTYDDEAESIESQCFSFVHSSMSAYKTWWGFTASNSADNSPRADYLTYQFSNMGKGGIMLDENGEVKLDSNGAPIVNPEIPYLVGYYSPYMAKRPLDMTFNNDGTYEAVSMYVNLNSYTYYAVEEGYAPARAFTNGDSLSLTVHGVAPDGTEKELTIEPASYSNGDLTINRGWRFIDLSSLGVINELYFTMNTTDSGAWGANTPLYFCLDKLRVRKSEPTAVLSPSRNETIAYNRADKVVTIGGASFTQVLNAEGEVLLSSDQTSFSIASLPAGVYIIRTPHKSIKIAK